MVSVKVLNDLLEASNMVIPTSSSSLYLSFDMDFYFYVLIGLLVFFGFTVRVVTGFGVALILAPLIYLFLGLKHAVILIVLSLREIEVET
jgi:hypothetical protein